MSEDADRWERVKEIVGDAFECEPSELDAFLEAACGGDRGLRAEVDSLVRESDTTSSGLLGGIASTVGEGLGALLDTAGEFEPDTRVGPYRIVRPLARGGMGSVYIAEQETPRRRVALKVLRSEYSKGFVRQRFRHEVEILACLHHPTIAQVYDAGVHRRGEEGDERPWFAMELVEGRPLDQAAEALALDLRARLELLARVADGVQHAHQRGVIHRDLKPDNILVDTSAAPKILDFGIARATASEARITTVETQAGQLLGTIAYMSPEQVGGDPDAIDTRSDVYALGVILYELLSGELPVDVRGRPLTEALRAVAEESPRPLSHFDREYRGDLETIVATALEKDKERRYASASELAADLRRFLDDEPIMARAPSAFYHLKKLARRHRGLFAGLSIALLALILGFAISLRYWLRAEDALDDSERAGEETAAALGQARKDRALALDAEEQAEAALVQALRSSREAIAVRDFLESLFAAADPGEMGRDVKVADLLAVASEKVDTDYEGEPWVRARVHATIGWTWFRLGELEKSIASLEKAHALYRELQGPAGDRTIEVGTNQLALVLLEQGEFERVRELVDEALPLVRAKHGEKNFATLALRARDAGYFYWKSDYPEARRRYERLLADLEALPLAAAGDTKPDPEHADPEHIEHCLTTLGDIYLKLGEAEKGLELTRRIAESRRARRGPDHVETLFAEQNLAVALAELGQYPEAEAIYRRVIQKGPAVWGPHHKDLLAAEGNFAAMLSDLGRLEECRKIYESLIPRLEEHVGPSKETTLIALNNYCVLLMQLDLYEEVAPQTEILRRRCLATYGENHPMSVGALANHANVIWKAGRLEEAEPLVKEVLTKRRELLGEKAFDTVVALNNYGRLLQELERPREALARYLEADRLVRENYPGNLAGALHISLNLARALQELEEEPERVRQLLAESCAASRQLPEDNAHRRKILRISAEILEELGDRVEAEALRKERAALEATLPTEKGPADGTST